MKRLLAAVALALVSLAGFGASAASAEGQVCHSIHIVVNGEDVVNDAACNALPGLPALP